MEQNFTISDVNISVCSEGGLQVSEKWQRFSQEGGEIHLRYRICKGESLPTLPDAWSFADSRVRCAQEGRLRQYLDSHGEAYCTVVEREESLWEIYLMLY